MNFKKHRGGTLYYGTHIICLYCLEKDEYDFKLSFRSGLSNAQYYPGTEIVGRLKIPHQFHNNIEEPTKRTNVKIRWQDIRNPQVMSYKQGPDVVPNYHLWREIRTWAYEHIRTNTRATPYTEKEKLKMLFDELSSKLKTVIPKKHGPLDYVYLLESPDYPGRYKVGKAVDVVARLQACQVGSPVHLQVVASLPILKDRGTRWEKHFHRRFRKFRHHGEWFDLPPSISRPLIKFFKETTDANLCIGSSYVWDWEHVGKYRPKHFKQTKSKGILHNIRKWVSVKN